MGDGARRGAVDAGGLPSGEREAPAGGPEVRVGLNAVIVAVTDHEPRILTVEGEAVHAAAGRSAGSTALPPEGLPYGPLDPDADRTLERTLRKWVRRLTGLELGYVEQLYTFGDRDRDPMAGHDGERWISVAYLALVREQASEESPSARWRPVYAYVPWEDHREGVPPDLGATVRPGIDAWIDAAASERERTRRRTRAGVAFGMGGSSWDEERVLERYELLFEVGLVQEAARVPVGRGEAPAELGRAMAADHRRILATALGRIRGKLKYRPVVFELLPERFTLSALQRVVEALAGVRLHKQNFRRLVERQGLVEGTGELETATGGRPAELFRFRPEVLRERRAPGVGLPGV